MDAVERRKTHVAEGIPALRNLTLEAENVQNIKNGKRKNGKVLLFQQKRNIMNLQAFPVLAATAEPYRASCFWKKSKRKFQIRNGGKRT